MGHSFDGEDSLPDWLVDTARERAASCIFVERMIALGDGCSLWTLAEFTEFILHMLPTASGGPCRVCGRYELGDLDPGNIHPLVDEEDQCRWTWGLDALFAAKLPHLLPCRIWREYETRWNAREVFASARFYQG